MYDIRVYKLDSVVDEIQVYYKGIFVGAGAWTKPYGQDSAVKQIISAWVGVEING